MGRKRDGRETGSCGVCANGTPVPTKEGEPRLVRCAVRGKVFVAGTRRKCLFARWTDERRDG